ncbi:TPA: fimbrial protein, partial [Enterobacter cloacae]|nr:fimbrial protein [Enterobacter cloacae]
NTTDAVFTGAELFPSTTANGSAVLPLIISQTTKGVLKSGQYSGVVSLMLTQATTA